MLQFNEIDFHCGSSNYVTLAQCASNDFEAGDDQSKPNVVILIVPDLTQSPLIGSFYALVSVQNNNFLTSYFSFRFSFVKKWTHKFVKHERCKIAYEQKECSQLQCKIMHCSYIPVTSPAKVTQSN